MQALRISSHLRRRPSVSKSKLRYKPLEEKIILQKTKPKNDLKNKSVKPTGKVLKNSKELPREKIVSVGICRKCGEQIIRPYPCDTAVCTCESATLIKLEPAMVVDSKSYAKLSRIAKIADVSVERLVQVLLETYIEKLYEKGLINLAQKT